MLQTLLEWMRRSSRAGSEGGESVLGHAVLEGMLAASNAATLCPSTGSKLAVVEILDTMGSRMESSSPGSRQDADPLMDALLVAMEEEAA